MKFAMRYRDASMYLYDFYADYFDFDANKKVRFKVIIKAMLCNSGSHI